MGSPILPQSRVPVNRNDVGAKPQQVGDPFMDTRTRRTSAAYRCHCGNLFVACCYRVRCGHTKSCGCGRMSTLKKRRETALYQTWKGIIGRCFNPKSKHWKNYGGRGITMCAEWRASYDVFEKAILSEIGERPENLSLDRRDNNRGYEPGNVRWADRKVQNRNQRRVVKASDGTPIVELAEMVGVVNPKTARDRVSSFGWSTEQAISTPPRFERYQRVISSELIDDERGRHLRLTLECGCTVKRQAKSDRATPKRVKCSVHFQDTTGGAQ